MKTLLNDRRYEKLVASALPVVIHSEREYERLLETAGELMERPSKLTEEEGRLLELVAMLIEEYEDRVHPLPTTDPAKLLAYLLEEKHLRPRDVTDVLPASRISEILAGKREISKAQAKLLAERFRVSPELFLYGSVSSGR